MVRPNGVLAHWPPTCFGQNCYVSLSAMPRIVLANYDRSSWACSLPSSEEIESVFQLRRVFGEAIEDWGSRS